MSEHRVELLELARLKGWEGNPKRHATAEIQASLERFGFVKPVVIDERTGVIVAGHGRVETLRRMQQAKLDPPAGIAVRADAWLVPVLRGLSWPDELERNAYILASNKLEESGGWDDPKLAVLLKRQDQRLNGVGWTAEEVEALLGGLNKQYQTGATPREAYENQYTKTEVRSLTFYFTPQELQEVEEQMVRVGCQMETDDRKLIFLEVLRRHENART